MDLTTCDLSDQLADQARVLPPVFRHFGGRSRFLGAVMTVQCFEDNSRVKELLSTPGHGRVLVVDGGGSTRCALMGDLIAREAVAHGWAGVVIWGCVRDTAVLRTLDLGVLALAPIPRKSTRRGLGQTDLAIELAGMPCKPGDMLVADEDGAVVVDRAVWAQHLAK
jgi:regulator of ribonuclease activity A